MFTVQIPENLAGDLTSSGASVAVAESAAGGLISATLLSVPGASRYFAGGTVVYTRESRKRWLNLSADDVRGLEPLTPAMAAVFAERVRETMGATWGVAELGAAGPGGSYGGDAGIAAIAVAGPVELSRRIETGHNRRSDNMVDFANAALELLASAVSAAGER